MVNCIHIEIEQFPREKNDKADYFSKIVEKNDCGVSLYILDLIQSDMGYFRF